MATQCVINGSTGIRSAISVLQFTALFIGFVVIHRLDSTTQQNSATLVRHEAKLAVHQENFEAIYFGTFSREFAHNVKRYIPNEQGR
jgi:hypothetical protein